MAVGITLNFEGGYTNDSLDPGGETNFGITRRSYPDIDIKNLTREQASAIYKRDYWDQGGCNQLPWPMSAIHFDTCVLFGISRAAGFKELSVNAHDYLLRRIQAHLERVRQNRTQEKFLRGWLNRCMKLYTTLLG